MVRIAPKTSEDPEAVSKIARAIIHSFNRYFLRIFHVRTRHCLDSGSVLIKQDRQISLTSYSLHSSRKSQIIMHIKNK